ncbi:MAG TPA: hypothetical protein VGC21_10180 [Telluria sp.]|jgi:hypothetical protein
MSGILTKRELHSLMMTRANKDRSYAQPRHAYLDPAVSVLFERERLERERARAKRNSLMKNYENK